jgi:hypothetical protein
MEPVKYIFVVRQPLFPALCQTNVSTLPLSYLMKINFNIILKCTSVSSKLCFPLTFTYLTDSSSPHFEKLVTHLLNQGFSVAGR